LNRKAGAGRSRIAGGWVGKGQTGCELFRNATGQRFPLDALDAFAAGGELSL
jgi:hypothetical protein